MRTGVLITVIVVAVLVVAGAAWFGVSYGLTRDAGPVVSENRNLSTFTKVDISGRGTLVITQGDVPALSIEAQQTALDRLETSVSGDTLRIQQRAHWFDFGVFLGRAPITYHVTVPHLRAIKLSGAVAVQGGGPFDADQFVIECSGSSEVNLAVRASNLRVNTSGSSDITLTGQVDTAAFDSSGSTNILARGLTSRIATIDCSGSSDIEVNASERLNVDASGSSTVRHLGDPILNTNISGSGEVQRLEQ